MSSSHKEEGGSIAILFWLPIFAVLFVMCSLGWLAAKFNAKYRLVRAMVFPVTFVLTQVFGATVFMCFGWIIALILGSHSMANYVLGNVSELALYGSLFDPITIPSWHIFLYQFILWLIVGRMVGRALTLSIYDSAIQSIAAAEQIHSYYVRERVCLNDTGYAKAYAFYKKRGGGPLLGIMLVGLSRTPVGEYY